MASCECGLLKRLWNDADDCEGVEEGQVKNMSLRI